VIGGSFSYGERLLVFLKVSRSLDLSRNSFMARTGVMKLRSIPFLGLIAMNDTKEEFLIIERL
jgi:hypothetical protein